jgi:hypothetical protein
MKDDKNDIICNNCKKPGYVKAKCFKSMKKNQVQGQINSGDTRNIVAGALVDVVLSSVKNMVSTMRFGSVTAVHHATIAIMMTDSILTQQFLKK